MPSTIILNQSNIVPDGKNSSLVYRFPNSVAFPHHEIAVQQLSIYYSWENINANPLANNKFSLTWITGTTQTPFNFTIPNGLYEVTTINKFLQYSCIQNGLFLINASGQNVYYAEFLVNPTLYAVQINTFPFPTSADWTQDIGTGQWTGNPGTEYAGWKTPLADTPGATVAFPGFPDTTFNPSLTIPSNLSKILGFTIPNPYVTPLNIGVGTNLSFLSNVAPQVQPNSSAYLSVSNISNKYAVPSSILYSISPSVAFGEQIVEQPPQFAWNTLLNGTYNEIRMQILGIDFQPLTILDPNMTIVLCIRDTHDSGLQEVISRAAGGK